MFILPIVLLCCVILCATGHRDSEDTVPTGRIATPPPQRQGLLVYRLTKDIYSKFLEREQRALVLVSQPGQEPLHQFYLCAQRYLKGVPASFRWFYLPLESHKSVWIVELYADIGYQHHVPAYVKYKWSWVQYYNVDVKLLLCVLLACVIYCTAKLCKCCCRCCCSGSKEKNRLIARSRPSFYLTIHM